MRSRTRRSSTTYAQLFPKAAIGHAYASTEAGVAFDVNDGLAGFPSGFVGSIRDGVELKILDGSLRIRSPRVALRYIGKANLALVDDQGFVDTGDIVEQLGDRYYFVGRKGGIINIGGLKVHPEEIESSNQPASAGSHVARASEAKSHHRLDRRC